MSSEIDKFAFVGAANSGKSTMTQISRNWFAGDHRVHVLDEGAHLYFQDHPDTDKSVITQERIQNFVIAREQDAASQPETELIICDRSGIDGVVYMQQYDTPKNANRLFANVKPWLPTYTSFILLDPTGVPYEIRPNSLETPQERQSIHDKFLEFCISNQLPHVEISGPLQERADRVYKVLYERVRNKAIFNRPQSSFGTNQI